MRTPVRLLVPLILCLPLAAQEKFTLRYRFEPGKTCWVLQTQEMTQNMSVQGQEMKTTMSTCTWLEGKVADVKDGVATIEQRYARITARSDSPMMKVDYDSDVEGSRPGPMRSMAELVGKTAKARVDETGRIQEVTPPQDVRDLEKVGATLRQGFEQQLAAWPKDPVAIGATWTSTMDFPMESMGTMKATVTNKLVSVEDQVVTIEQTMVMDSSGLKMPGGLKMEVPKAGGTGRYSLGSHMPIEAAMDMEMKMVGSEGAPMSMTMTQHMVMKQVDAPAPKKDAAKAKAGAGR